MREGVDYAWGNPGTAALTAAGKTFVCRYVSTPGNTKNITRSEATTLKKAGLDIVIVFETTANRAMAGYVAGSTDAKSAEAQAKSAGAPAGSVIYFAVDFDATVAQQQAINRYLSGASGVLGKGRVGVYGGYWVVKRALDGDVCSYAWQTYAWSGGLWDKRAQLQQYRNGVTIGGVSCDLDRATTADFGQWGYQPTPLKKPKKGSLPGPTPKPPWFWAALKEFLARRKKT